MTAGPGPLVRGPLVRVDVAALWHAVHYRLFRTEKTAEEVAGLLGFSPQIFSDLKSVATGHGRRASSGYQPSGAIFLTICWWLAADPRDFQKIVRDDAGVTVERLFGSPVREPSDPETAGPT